MENEQVAAASKRLIDAGFYCFFEGLCCQRTRKKKFKIDNNIWQVDLHTNRGSFAFYIAGKPIACCAMNKFNDVFDKYITEIISQA